MGNKKVFSSIGLLPKEEMLEVKPDFMQLIIGVPKESSFQENRVSLTPDSVGLLVANGHAIVIEKGAGDSSSFTDKEYSENGADIDGYIKKTNSSKSKLSGDFLFKKKDKKELNESEDRPEVVNKEAIA